MRSPRSELAEAIYYCRDSFKSAAFFSFFINMLMLFPSIYMMQVYDRVLGSNSTSTLLMLTLLAVLLFSMLGALEWIRSQVLIRVSTRFDLLLNERLYRVLFRQALVSGGKSSAQPLSDLLALRQFLTGQGLFAFFDAPWLPIYVGLLFLFNPAFGAVAVVSVLLLILLAIWNERATHDDLEQANQLSVESSNATARNLRNAEVVHALGMLPALMGRWKAKQKKLIILQALASEKGGLISALSKTFRVTIQSLILGLGAWLAINKQISPGLMIGGSILLGRALAPIDLMIGSWKQFLTARTAYERLNVLLANFPAEEDRMPLPAPKGALRVEQAMVVPPGSKVAVIKGISFAIDAGTSIALVGASASGKSTLARALLGIWPVASGAVRLDGANVMQAERSLVGPYIGYLPQDIELFDGTIADNIARFGEVDANFVVDAAIAAGVHEMILRLPQGYDTEIGGGGGALSAGQRQRVGLARALYGNPVLVVLDEPNSNLDDVGEQALAQALLKLKQRGCTVIAITHRVGILGIVDRIMVLNDGLLVLDGPRDDVLAKLNQRPTQPVQGQPA
ncbi:MAG: type I secretion system permease/ATPase [Methylococcaceae bacterium]|nr:type I secretion system permease/ATPase [Methylococcaceae bacterium]MDD1608024.1 type I secretion system permease/ATPase [Methylococcaceae bacterium]MDD1610094.1 type I secretion system permease/ATPase [Methylococcaceae bacterium]MDD1616103.1 type I secretion system permease/ATPase [Methylococcaceae bacterium]OYV18607.1 MAG: ATP-binding cassette, subfamily C, bacterial [Methylococcaceae bacterium NSP1-2]